MALVLALQSVNREGSTLKRTYKATVTVNYPTGGDTADFTSATNPNFQPNAFPGRLITADQVKFNDVCGGHSAEFVAGTTNANHKIQFWASGANELANGAYPASMTADELFLTVVTPLGV